MNNEINMNTSTSNGKLRLYDTYMVENSLESHMYYRRFELKREELMGYVVAL